MELPAEVLPGNPRLLWVLGPSRWYVASLEPPSEVEAHQTATIASYERGLELARTQHALVTDRLQPAWGEPELLMSLAWAHLNKATPDRAAAERYARQALALVPGWHYVRDILLPQILGARPQE